MAALAHKPGRKEMEQWSLTVNETVLVCIGSRHVLWLSWTVQKHPFRLTGDSNLSAGVTVSVNGCVSLCLGSVMVTCPACTPPFTKWKLKYLQHFKTVLQGFSPESYVWLCVVENKNANKMLIGWKLCIILQKGKSCKMCKSLNAHIFRATDQ